MKFKVLESRTVEYLVEAENEDAIWDGDYEIISEEDVGGEIHNIEECED